MSDKFTASNIVTKRPSWMTPNFNPEAFDKRVKEDKFTAYSVIPNMTNYLRK